jgi:hypothetical protein
MQKILHITILAAVLFSIVLPLYAQEGSSASSTVSEPVQEEENVIVATSTEPESADTSGNVAEAAPNEDNKGEGKKGEKRNEESRDDSDFVNFFRNLFQESDEDREARITREREREERRQATTTVVVATSTATTTQDVATTSTSTVAQVEPARPTFLGISLRNSSGVVGALQQFFFAPHYANEKLSPFAVVALLSIGTFCLLLGIPLMMGWRGLGQLPFMGAARIRKIGGKTVI